ISEEHALADTTLRPQMTNLGSITGMELPTGPYTFRHGNGQALDKSSEKTMIVGRLLCSPVYRRAAEHHLATSQFLRFPEELRLEIYARHSGRLSRPEITDRPDASGQWDEPHHRSSTAEETQSCVTGGGRSPPGALRNLRWRQEKALLTEIKERYKKEQPVIDIQQQLKGLPVAEQEALRAAEYVFAERVQAIDALFIFARSSMEEEF
ncbi:MAG: hypothetical protein Q9203_006373, partial [Teloschistes exilis]